MRVLLYGFIQQWFRASAGKKMMEICRWKRADTMSLQRGVNEASD
jgi:hypothetical protein